MSAWVLCMSWCANAASRVSQLLMMLVLMRDTLPFVRPNNHFLQKWL